MVAEGADVEGSDTDPVPTALSVDSSTTSGSQLGVVVGGTRVVLPDPDVPGPVLPEPTGWSGGDTGTKMCIRDSGLSDTPADLEELTFEAWVDDALVVLDSVDSARAVVLGAASSAILALMVGALHPERCV